VEDNDKTYRGIYALDAGNGGAAFFFSKPFMLVLLLISFLLPHAAYFILKRDASLLDITMTSPSSSKVDTPVRLEFRYKSKRPLLIASTAEITLEMNNLLFSAKKTRKVRISLSDTKPQYAEFAPELCGELRIYYVNVSFSDVFGICSMKLKTRWNAV